ncbi:uncharacterized protein [Pseudochaenichthys georgianus]|uniref:uncharacterized protein isoform X1 n=1 Tax=Pseudochaenichthys georgianus TaxID=52239 RepID=UPI00146D1FFD|nr:uncharacterized protein si:ch211-139g16.8 isoform X1 [Pseudochaenichthys georgianus]
MDRLFCFSLLLTYLPVTESTEGCLSQTNKMIWRKTGQSVFLKCSLSSNCLAKGLQFEWFAFKENVHLPLNVIKNAHKYSLDKASLNIKSLHTNESGIYYCAVFSGYKAPGTPYVALGTTLVVTEHISPLVRHILLWLSFALLATYSLAIGTLILKKCGCKTGVCRKRGETDKVVNIKKKSDFCFNIRFTCLLNWEKLTEAKRGTGTKACVNYCPVTALTLPHTVCQSSLSPAFLNNTKQKQSPNISV